MLIIYETDLNSTRRERETPGERLVEMRIIFANGHIMIREALRPFIERVAPGATVLEAGTLVETLDLIGSDTRLVVLDLDMPGMNGLHGLAAIKQAHPAVACVILSPAIDRDNMLKAIRLGADGFIPKSLSGAAMTAALQLVLAGERFIPSLPGEQSSDGMGLSRSRSKEQMIGRLTPREREIIRLLSEGLPNKVIASRLDVSEVTVKSHLGNVFRKLNVQSRLQVMRLLFSPG